MERGPHRPAAHYANDGGEADVGPGAAADITSTAMVSPKAASKQRFSSVMRSRSAAGARRESTSTTVASSIIELQFQSIRHLMDDEDEAAPKTAGQWSQRLQSHLKSKFDRGPSAAAAVPKLHRNQTWNGNASAELHIEDIQFDPGLDGEGSDPDILFSQSHQELQTDRLQYNQEQGSASLSMLKLENSFTAESMVGGWFASKRRASKTSVSNNNNSKTSVVENNSSFELSAREEFQVVSAMNSGDSPHSSKSNMERTQTQSQMAISPTTPRRSLFSKGRPILAPKLAKQLTDFRLKRKGLGKTSSKDESESPVTAEDDEDGGFSVSTEKLSINNARISLTDDEDETMADSDDDTPHQSNTKEKQAHQKKRRSPARPRKVRNNEGPTGELHKREVNQELVEWRREKFKDKIAGTTGGIVNRQNKESVTSKSKSKASTVMLLDSSNQTGATGSGNNNNVLMVEQKSLSAKIKSTGKKPKRMKSANTKKSLALSLASSSKGSKKKSEEDDDAGTVLDDLFDDDDSTFFGNSEIGRKKDSSVSSPPKPARISRARTASADMIPPKDMFTSTRTTLSAELSSRPYSNNTERTERSAGSGGGSSRRDLRTSGGSLRGQRTTQVQSQTMRAERTTAAVRGERPGSYRLERTTAGSMRSQRTTASTESMPKKDDLASIFQKTAQRQRPKRRASLSSVDDFEKSFQLVDGAFLFGDGDKKDPESEFEADFEASDKASATELFHQSFSIGALLAPPQSNRSNGSSMPIIIPDNAASFIESFSLLSTDKVSKVSRDEKKLIRRKSLPSGSAHSNTAEEDMMRKSRTKSPTPTTGTATPKSSKRRSRRQSRTSELQASIASLQAPDLEIDSNTKDSESGAASSEKERMLGLAPSPADNKHMPRRRGSIGVSEKAAVPEVKETTMEKIRMRRASHRIERPATTRSSSKKRPGRQPSGTKTDETVMWQRRSPAAPGREQAREQERKPTRRHAHDHMREIKTNDFSHLLRRAKTHDGTTGWTPQDKKHDDSKKSSSRCLTPNSARRMMRRQTIQIDSPPLTPNRKERLRSIRKGDSAMADVIQHVGLDSSVQGETPARGGSPTRESSGRKITGRGRKTSEESVQKSSRSMYSSDDSELELAPTPKPAAPPMMPEDPMRRFTGTEYELAPTPKPTAPPKMPEDPMRRFVGKKSKVSSTRLKPRRHTSADPSIEPSVISVTKRRSTRNRRNTAHEALKQLEGVLTPAPLTNKLKVSALKKKNSTGTKTSKQWTSKEKKAASELVTVATPSKANRFRRTRSVKEDDSGAATTPPRVSSRSPRTSLTPSSSSKKTRRVKSEDGKGRAPRLRRIKTADESTTSSSKKSPSGQDSHSPTSGSEISGTVDEPHDAISNKRILNGMSF